MEVEFEDGTGTGRGKGKGKRRVSAKANENNGELALSTPALPKPSRKRKELAKEPDADDAMSLHPPMPGSSADIPLAFATSPVILSTFPRPGPPSEPSPRTTPELVMPATLHPSALLKRLPKAAYKGSGFDPNRLTPSHSRGGPSSTSGGSGTSAPSSTGPSDADPDRDSDIDMEDTDVLINSARQLNLDPIEDFPASQGRQSSPLSSMEDEPPEPAPKRTRRVAPTANEKKRVTRSTSGKGSEPGQGEAVASAAGEISLDEDFASPSVAANLVKRGRRASDAVQVPLVLAIPLPRSGRKPA
ncbi:hypothetical protein NLI96_g11926 [Meripilus lineatus]|uniref:Uncharacterized protein n=1 Tax=Meripilus lineatus TaxID=2056292 RepID=A0AAD5YCY6_9APHY|nr:hypothetical protein NLI96_g11926 [Physisporinus lineatus]